MAEGKYLYLGWPYVRTSWVQFLKCLVNISAEHEELDGGEEVYLGWPQVVYLG
jgi:hypothetical protein